MTVVPSHRHLLRLTVSMLIWVALFVWPTRAHSATLEQVLLFMGEGHSRLLLVLDEPAVDVSTHSSPAVGSAPARATVLLGGTTLSEKLLSAYRQRPGGAEMPVDQEGIHQLVFSEMGDQAQVVVELDRARSASITEVSDRALLLDLRLPQTTPDSSLPEARALAAWRLRSASSSAAAA